MQKLLTALEIFQLKQKRNERERERQNQESVIRDKIIYIKVCLRSGNYAIQFCKLNCMWFNFIQRAVIRTVPLLVTVNQKYTRIRHFFPVD